MERLKMMGILEYMWYIKLEDPPGGCVPWKGYKECTCERITNISRKLNGGSLLLTRSGGRKRH